MATDPYNNIKHPEKVLILVREFIDEHNITSIDVIEQSDRVAEYSPDLIAALCNDAGWAIDEFSEEVDDIVMSDYDPDNPDYYED
jgi:hypothetical protein